MRISTRPPKSRPKRIDKKRAARLFCRAARFVVSVIRGGGAVSLIADFYFEKIEDGVFRNVFAAVWRSTRFVCIQSSERIAFRRRERVCRIEDEIGRNHRSVGDGNPV